MIFSGFLLNSALVQNLNDYIYISSVPLSFLTPFFHPRVATTTLSFLPPPPTLTPRFSSSCFLLLFFSHGWMTRSFQSSPLNFRMNYFKPPFIPVFIYLLSILSSDYLLFQTLFKNLTHCPCWHWHIIGVIFVFFLHFFLHFCVTIKKQALSEGLWLIRAFIKKLYFIWMKTFT